MQIKVNKNKTFKFLILLSFFIMLFIPASLLAGTTPVTKDYKINLKAENLPLTEVAKKLNDLGIDVYIDRAEKDRVVNCEFKGIPFEKAIKMLAYPLNYAIVFSERGVVKELRIFKTNISPTNGYVAFHSKNNDNEKNTVQMALNKNITTSAISSTSSIMNYKAEINKKEKGNELNINKDASSYIIEGGALSGETAYAYNMWLNKRLAEMNFIAEQQKILTEKEIEASRLVGLNQNINNMAKINMQLTMSQKQSAGGTQDQTTKNLDSFYNYTNEMNKIMEAKRTQEIVNAQIKNMANYMYYQQRSQSGVQTNPYAANQSYYYTMSIIKNLSGKK